MSHNVQVNNRHKKINLKKTMTLKKKKIGQSEELISSSSFQQISKYI